MSKDRIILYEHHGRLVAVQEENKGKHRDNCLCFQGCVNFVPGSEWNCSIAQELFEFDKKHGVATPVWECSKFLSDDELTFKRLEKEKAEIELVELKKEKSRTEEELKELEEKKERLRVKLL